MWKTPASEIHQQGYAKTLLQAAALGGADLILTSPPYDDARTYGNAVSWKFEDYQRLGTMVKIGLKPGGHCLMVLDGPVRSWRSGMGTERSFTPWRVMLDWADRVGLRVPDRLAYGRMGMPGAYGGRFRNDWEPLLWFQKPGAAGFFDKGPLSRDAKFKTKRGKSGGRTADGWYYRQASGEAVEKGLIRRGNLWNYETTGNGHDEAEAFATDHPARFCVRFAEDAVQCFAPPGGLVCDPFLGSGTSAVAALRHRRRFFGGDLYGDTAGKPWAQWAHERCEAELKGKL